MINHKTTNKNIKITLPPQAEKAIEMLESNGFEAYAVGGSVRDSLLGKTPYDWDICTSCKPQGLIKIFSGYKIIETGLKHGTLTVIIDNMKLEITAFRRESDYPDHRRPSQVDYVSSLSEDLSRRDFTVNSLAYNKKSGLTDIFGGLNDLKNKVIRCVGDPNVRFEEDALRILRAIRFSSDLGFSVEEKTKKAIFKNKRLIKYISGERIRDELIKLLCGKDVLNALLSFREVIFFIIPELEACNRTEQNTPHHCYNVYEHITHSVSNIAPEPELRMAMLLHDIGKPCAKTTDGRGIDHFKNHPAISRQMSENILKRLKFPKKDNNYICELISQHDNRLAEDEKTVRKFISKHGKHFFNDYIQIRFADTYAQSSFKRQEKTDSIKKVRIIGEEIIGSAIPLDIRELDINGNDLQNMGLKGEQIGKTLNILLNAVLDNNVANNKNKLIEYITKARCPPPL